MTANLRQVLWLGGGVGSAIFVRAAFDGDWARAGVLGIAGSVLAGVLMFGLQSWLQKDMRREGIAPGHYPVRPRAEYRVDVREVGLVFEALHQGLSALGSKAIVEGDDRDGRLVARLPWDWKFGDGQTVKVRVWQEGVETRVSISSQPNGASTRLDFGRNYRNVILVGRAMEQKFGSSRVTKLALENGG